MRCLIALSVIAAVAASADLEELTSTFDGEYDNYAQWEADVEQGVNTTEAHAHLHSIFKRVPLPAFGTHVFYVQQYLDGTPSSIYRQRLYSFADADADAQATADIVLSIYSFDDPTQFVDAQLDLAKLTTATGLAPGNGTSALPGCEVHISKSSDGVFRGQTGPSCVVVDHYTGDKIRIEDSNAFAPDYVSIHERGFNATTGAVIFGGSTPDVLNRTRAAREFEGYVAVEHDDGTWLQMNIASIHDVGQIVPVVSATNETTPYAIELAYCVYPSGPDGKPFSVLKVAVHQQNYTHDGLNVPVAYSWTEPESTSIGINLRFIQTGLNLKK